MRLVHIGFPKTATTFLQEHVFPCWPKEFEYEGPREAAAVFGPVIDDDDTIYDSAGAAERLRRACRGSPRALFSYEPLTGAHYRTAFVNRSQIARRLKALGFERILITIRNQADALESAYKQYVKSGGVLQFADYARLDAGGPHYLHPRYFDYHSIYRLYADLFAPDNVLVLQHEHLGSELFLRQLCGFLGVGPVPVRAPQANVSLSYAKTRALRIINHFTYSAYRPSYLVTRRFSTSGFHRLLAALPLANGGRPFLGTDERAAVAAFYRESNAALRDAAGLDLDARYL